MSAEMYQEIILDYYRNPRNHGLLENPDVHSRDVNPLCGDVIEVSLRVKDGIVTEALFAGKGCAISQAATSMLMESIIGKKLEHVLEVQKQEVLDLLGIPVSFVRLKCALLGLKVLKIGVCEELGKTFAE